MTEFRVFGGQKLTVLDGKIYKNGESLTSYKKLEDVADHLVVKTFKDEEDFKESGVTHIAFFKHFPVFLRSEDVKKVREVVKA